MGYGYIDARRRNILQSLEEELGYKVDPAELEDLIKQKKELENSQTDYLDKDTARKKLFDAMENVLRSHIQNAYEANLNKKNVTLRDVLNKYTPPEMPVYNSDGNQISLDATPQI